jgi:hypothetical protein
MSDMEQFSALVGDICDASLDPDLWLNQPAPACD